MGTERIELRAFLAEMFETLGPAIPDRIAFSCRLEETPEVEANPSELCDVIADLLARVCASSTEVRLRTGTVAGRSGPHAFVEVGRPDAGIRIVVPVPVFRPAEMRVAGS